ncbi:hypothetical protein BH23BAC1_BH23BAC1_11980 [soil metagenome]
MNKEKYLFIFITYLGLLCAFTSAKSQNSQIDSLLKLSKTDKEDTAKVTIYLNISEELLSNDPQRARFYAERALILSKKINYVNGIGRSFNHLAICYTQEDNLDKAIQLHIESIKVYEQINNKKGIAAALNNIGIIEINQARYYSALEYLIKAVNKYEELGDTYGAGDAYSNLGVVSRKQGNFQEAIEYFLKALKIRDELKDHYGIAVSKGNLGNLYRDQFNYNTALSYYFQAMELFQVLEFKYEEGSTMLNIGITYQDQKKFREALEYYQKATVIFESSNSKFGMANCLSYLGSIYSEQQDYQASLESYHKAIIIFEELDNKDAVSGSLSEIGILMTKMGRYDEAYKNLSKGLKLSIEIGSKVRELDCYKGLYEYFEGVKDYKTSLEYYKLFTIVKDSIFNIDKSHQLAEIQTKYEIDKKEQENELLRKEQVVKNALIGKKDFENNVLISGVLIFLIFTGYFYFHNVQKKKINSLLSRQNEEINIRQNEIIKINEDLQDSQNQLHKVNKSLHKLNIGLETLVKERTAALQQINEELDTFLYQSSHALRRPIVTVMGLLQIARMEKNKKNLTDIYAKIDSTASRMDLMLRKLVMVSEINFTKGELEYIDFENTLKEVWANLRSTLDTGTMVFNLSVDEDVNFRADRKLIIMIFENLMENSILYHVESASHFPVLDIEVSSSSTNLLIKVHDNGMGIPDQAITRIFEMFTVANDLGKGFGLGLYIVRKAVDKLRGNIKATSKKNEFTTFYISLPKQNVSIG